MKKFISKYKIFITSVILSFVFLFFFKPVLEAIPYENAYHCPVINSVPYQKFCSTNMFTSIFNYVLSHDKVNEANRNQFFVSFIVMFSLYFIPLKFLWPVMIFQKKNLQIFNKILVIIWLAVFTTLIYYQIYDCIFVETYCEFGG
jgi:hypothetical protein